MQDVGRNYRNRLIQEKMLAFSLSIFEHKKLGSRILGFRIRMVLKIHATKTKKTKFYKTIPKPNLIFLNVGWWRARKETSDYL